MTVVSPNNKYPSIAVYFGLFEAGKQLQSPSRSFQIFNLRHTQSQTRHDSDDNKRWGLNFNAVTAFVPSKHSTPSLLIPILYMRLQDNKIFLKISPFRCSCVYKQIQFRKQCIFCIFTLSSMHSIIESRVRLKRH